MEHRHVISTSACMTCGGAVDGFKCPECGLKKPTFDPDHWRDCKRQGKMKLKCKLCGKVEIRCDCTGR